MPPERGAKRRYLLGRWNCFSIFYISGQARNGRLRKAIGGVENFVSRYDEMPPANRFSSPARHAQMQAMYEEWKAMGIWLVFFMPAIAHRDCWQGKHKMGDDVFPSGNPQYEEIQVAKAAYVESPLLKQKRTELHSLWREAVQEHGTAEYATEYLMQLDGELQNEEWRLAWEEEHLYVLGRLRLRADNLFVEVPDDGREGHWWPTKEFLAAEQDWRGFFNELKAALDGRTYAECVGTDLGGLLSQPLKRSEDYGFISIHRPERPYMIIRLHVGDPRRGWAWLI